MPHSAFLIFLRWTHSVSTWASGPFSSGSNSGTHHLIHTCFYLQRGDENDIRSINYYPESASFYSIVYIYQCLSTYLLLILVPNLWLLQIKQLCSFVIESSYEDIFFCLG